MSSAWNICCGYLVRDRIYSAQSNAPTATGTAIALPLSVSYLCRWDSSFGDTPPVLFALHDRILAMMCVLPQKLDRPLIHLSAVKLPGLLAHTAIEERNMAYLVASLQDILKCVSSLLLQLVRRTGTVLRAVHLGGCIRLNLLSMCLARLESPFQANSRRCIQVHNAQRCSAVSGRLIRVR